MKEEFQQLYEKYYSRVYYFLLKQVHNRKDLAEELTQETFYQVFISLHRYRGECDIVTWILQIGKNTSYRYFKKNPFHADYDSEVIVTKSEISNVKSVEQEYEDKVRVESVIDCIKQLKENYREVMLLRLQENLSFREIGAKLHISENSAKVIYFRGKEMIKKELGMNSMEKQTCILVKELLPLYQDKAVSEESNHIIEEHLKECDSCKVLLDEMRKEDELEEGINQPTEEIKGDYKKERENYINLAKRLKKRRRIIICSTIVAVLFLFICFTSWFQTFFIAGGMEPTYEAGTNCVVNKLIYNFRAPKRGEVVVLSHHDIVIMKRIIGEPGDTIDIRHGKVYINEELLDSEYTFGSLNQKGNIKYPIVLGEEEYFVLGDNYEQSLDSRYLEFGLVSRDKIFGKVMFQTKFSLIRTTVTTATKE